MNGLILENRQGQPGPRAGQRHSIFLLNANKVGVDITADLQTRKRSQAAKRRASPLPREKRISSKDRTNVNGFAPKGNKSKPNTKHSEINQERSWIAVKLALPSGVTASEPQRTCLSISQQGLTLVPSAGHSLRCGAVGTCREHPHCWWAGWVGGCLVWLLLGCAFVSAW